MVQCMIDSYFNYSWTTQKNLIVAVSNEPYLYVCDHVYVVIGEKQHWMGKSVINVMLPILKLALVERISQKYFLN